MKFKIDNCEFTSNKNETVLDAILHNGLYIPHLCSHPELVPYGGCRLCSVEIEGMRGYPTACTTYVTDGMVIRTKSKKLEEMRKDILQLILSEHPSGCLVCEEDCSEFMGSIKKVGVTTGCRWCPQDKSCELQDVVEYIGIKDTEFNVSYREFPVEKEDPFFDRDYNLCIYCGRCVRICNEYRKSSVISFKQRGKLTTIGPAFSLSHVDANCEFCGACVSVCPTGTLSEKAKKWSGAPDEYISTFCTLCSLKCKIKVSLRNGRVVGTLPPGELHYSTGDLCVKGRFCLNEIINSPERSTVSKFRFPEGSGVVRFEEALEKTAEIIYETSGDRIAVYISPDLSTEELAAASQFSKKVLKTRNITSSVFTPEMISLLPLFEKGITLSQFERSDSFISLFLNGNYGYAPVTLAIKRGKDRGKIYHRIGWINDITTQFADKDINILPDETIKFLEDILIYLKNGKGADEKAKTTAELLKSKKKPVIIIGLEILNYRYSFKIISLISEIIKISGSSVFIPDSYGNLRGLLSIFDLKSSGDVNKLIFNGNIDLIYLIGENPFSKKPAVKNIVYQNPFLPPEYLDPDIIFPMAMWGEVSGKYVAEKKKNITIKEFSKLQGHTKKSIDIFNGISEKMGFSKQELSGKNILKNFPLSERLKYPKNMAGLNHSEGAGGDSLPYLFIQEKNPHFILGTSLSKIVKGMSEIVPEDTVLLNPGEGLKLKVTTGDMINVRITGKGFLFPVRLNRNIPEGVAYMITSSGKLIFDTNPSSIRLRRE